MENNNTENKIIFDININNIQDIYGILLNKSYDFATFEIDEEKVSLKFRKDWKVVEEKFLKFPIYSEILIKAKTTSWLDVWVTKEEQEGSWELIIDWKKFNCLSKVVPTKFWEKLFLKLKVIEEKVKTNSWPQKIELWKVIGFFWVILLILLIVGWSFLSFIVLNAKTIDDVQFFLALWINLNEINSFIWKTIQVFFSILVSVLTLFLVIYLFKFLTTKKIFKRKRTIAWILSLLLFILTFSSATAWMYLDRKVKNLPKWDILALWDVQLFDNKVFNSKIIEWLYLKESKKTSVWEAEKKSYSNITVENAKNLIWPVDILFDVSQLEAKESSWNMKVETFVWMIWNETEETKVPRLIKKFDKKWSYDVKVKFIFNNWEEREFDNKKAQIPSIWITWVVWIREKSLASWARQITFDATSIKNLWKFEWYNMEDENPVPNDKNIYNTKPIFDESVFKFIIKNWETFVNEKYFVIDWQEEGQITWDIEFTKSIMDDKEYTFRVANQKISDWVWFVEKYIWRIDWRELTKNWDIDNPEKSSEVKNTFLNYWKYEISVELVPTSWEVRKLTKVIDVWRDLKIKDWLKFLVEWESYDNVRHNKSTFEYFVNEFWIPSTLEIDARYVKSDNEIYSLDTVAWDYNSDWNIDETSKKWKITINKEWREKVTVKYKFKNIRIPEDTIDINEIIYIEAVKKEYEIKFKINQNTEYAPATVWFDASQSYIKDWNISKFIWDYGDGISEEADAVVKGHRYLTPWEYDIKLTIVWNDWKKFSTTKKLVLKPKAQKLKIKSSMKEAPVYQWIDFDSSESIWDIAEYRWDFGDGWTSFEANPTHSYDKPWTYKVILKVEFRNRNIMEDSMSVTITN